MQRVSSSVNVSEIDFPWKIITLTPAHTQKNENLRGVGEGINPIWGFPIRKSVLNGGWRDKKCKGSEFISRSYHRSLFEISAGSCKEKSISNYKPIYGKFMNSPKNRCSDRRIRCLSRDKIFREKLNAFLSPRRPKLEK